MSVEAGGGVVESVVVEGRPKVGLGYPTVSSVPEVVPAVMADLSVFSGGVHSKTSDSEVVGELRSGERGVNGGGEDGAPACVDKQAASMGAAILDIAVGESWDENRDVTRQHGGFGVGRGRWDGKTEFVLENACVTHGVGGCYSCTGAVLDLEVELIDIPVEGVVVGSAGAGFPGYRPVSKPVVVDYVMSGGERFDRPCGSHCGRYHKLGGSNVQLNPCTFFDECFSYPEGVDPKAGYIFKGVSQGFSIVDKGYTKSYECLNYSSIEMPGA